MSLTTFHDILRRTAWRLPDRTFLTWIDRNRSITFAQGAQQSEWIAGALASLGVGKGDRVGILAHNGLDYVLAMLGAWRLGAISTHISVLQADNLAYYVNDSTPKVLIYTGDKHDAVVAQRPNMPSVQCYICFDGAKEGAQTWDSLLKAKLTPPPDTTDAMDGAHLSYTSGTSGPPKGVLLGHGFVSRAAHCIAERIGLSSDDVSLGPTSLASSYHLVANLLPGMHRGVALGLMTQWDRAVAWDDMQQRGVTVMVGNPLLFADLLNECRKRDAKPPALRILLSGGAPVPPDIKRAFVDKFGIFVVESFGMSELGGFVALGFPRREPESRLFAIGPTLPDREVRIVDEHDKELPSGQPGQIVIRDGYMLRYWNMPEKTAEVLRDGWLHTGDIGVMDAEGYISILGRLSERIVSEGKIIFPRPLEEALLRHPSVRYACVIGKPDPIQGEIVKGIVELYAGKQATPEVLLSHCRNHLGPASPDLIEIVPEMPMTPTGKIGRALLQKREREA